MTIKINEEQSLAGMNKAMSASLDNAFEMENVELGVVERFESKPMLLTALFGNSTDDVYLETNTIKYDDLQETLQLPNGKTFEAYGDRLSKDKGRQLIYTVGSRGLSYNVAPKDYANKRQAGTNELMTEEYVIAQMLKKSRKAWDLDDELGFASLLTGDTNYEAGGPNAVYDYYNDIYGTARPAKIDMTLGSANDHISEFAAIYDQLHEELDNVGGSMTRPVILCGKDFYNSRFDIEKQEGLARDIRGPLDLASMEVPRDNFGSGSGIFQYQYFDSHDGFRYIRYTASIKGSKLIADADAYVVPVGCDVLFKRAFAPAQDRENVNTTALPMYTQSKVSNRTGVHVAQESNKLFMNINPKLIIALTTSD